MRKLCHIGDSNSYDRNFQTKEKWKKAKLLYVVKTYEPPYDKSNKMTAPSEDSDQPGHPPSQSDRSLRCPHEESLGAELPNERTSKNLKMKTPSSLGAL